jgi:RNA polymerase sigma-70 factor (ECF subfamily)
METICFKNGKQGRIKVPHIDPTACQLEHLLDAARPRLVALCYRLTGDSGDAEDLAQETLYEAWRHRYKLRDPAGVWPWLAAIARNICLRWWRARGQVGDGGRGPDQAAALVLLACDDDYDLDVELERAELVELLDRALALLPPNTRDLLVEHYIRESPHAAIADRLGLSVATVAKRLERGRLRLKRLLATDLLREATVHGLVESPPDGWRETSIWCTVCGTRYLFGRFTPQRELQLICVGCSGCSLPISLYTRGGSVALFNGIRGFRGALNRLATEQYEQLAGGIPGRAVGCPRCRAEAPLYAAAEAATVGRYFAGADCPRCGTIVVHTALCFLALQTPAGRRFRAVHTRLRTLPTREVESLGIPAVVTGYESVTTGARFHAVYARDSFRLLGIHGALEE